MKVVVTGFAGTLGTAFTEYLLDRGDTVIGVDNNEWAVASFPDHPHLTKLLGDCADISGSCDLLIHCAAYKHVDLLEDNPEACHHNNILSTEMLYMNVDAKQILFISTDKAVEPVSRYGSSKAWGEKMTRQCGGVIARLGNIIGSTGSVIPKWEACLKTRSPLPITDLRMKRWTISATSAVQKVMGMLPKAQPGDVIIPEMGEPESLESMINEFLHEHGENRGYQTIPIGIRPGEKLEEKLIREDEALVRSVADSKKGFLGRIYRKDTYESAHNGE